MLAVCKPMKQIAGVHLVSLEEAGNPQVSLQGCIQCSSSLAADAHAPRLLQLLLIRTYSG